MKFQKMDKIELKSTQAQEGRNHQHYTSPGKEEKETFVMLSQAKT